MVHATGLTNGPSPHELLDAYRGEQQAVAARLEATPIAELPSIAAWRQVFSGFGAKPTQYRNAAEALLRRLSKQGDIPSISMLVDVGNLVSIRYGLPVAVLDSDSIADGITVRFANGDERFSDLGSSESDSPDPGEVIFIDGDGVVSARRWCWRQSALTATGPATVAALFVVEGHHDTAAHDVAAAVNDLTALLATYQPKAQASSFELPSHGQRGER